MARQTLDQAAGHDDAPATDQHDTIHPHTHAAVETPAPTKAKVCIVCGANVAGQRRYKDGAGRYYCEECFNAQMTDASDNGTPSRASAPPPPPAPVQKKKRLASCPDCKNEFAPEVLIDFGGTKLCEKCLHHRELAAKREAARIAAAQEEARQQEKRKKMGMLIAGAVVGVVVLYAIVRLVIG